MWDFGDNTGVQQGESMVHTFRTPGTYTITARAVYDS